MFFLIETCFCDNDRMLSKNKYSSKQTIQNCNLKKNLCFFFIIFNIHQIMSLQLIFFLLLENSLMILALFFYDVEKIFILIHNIKRVR